MSEEIIALGQVDKPEAVERHVGILHSRRIVQRIRRILPSHVNACQGALKSNAHNVLLLFLLELHRGVGRSPVAHHEGFVGIRQESLLVGGSVNGGKKLLLGGGVYLPAIVCHGKDVVRALGDDHWFRLIGHVAVNGALRAFELGNLNCLGAQSRL